MNKYAFTPKHYFHYTLRKLKVGFDSTTQSVFEEWFSQYMWLNKQECKQQNTLPCNYLIFKFAQMSGCNESILSPLRKLVDRYPFTKYEAEFARICSILGWWFIPGTDSIDPKDLPQIVDRKVLGEDSTCSICLESFDKEKQIIVWCRSCCGTNFHQICIDQWHEKGTPTCPLCRTKWNN